MKREQKINLILHTDICWLQRSKDIFLLEIETSLRQRLEDVAEYREYYKTIPINYIFSISLYNDVNKTLQETFIDNDMLVKITNILSRLDPEGEEHWRLILICEEKGEVEVFTQMGNNELTQEVLDFINNLRSREPYKNQLMAGNRNIFYPVSYFTDKNYYVPDEGER